jgi:hypothetical protein
MYRKRARSTVGRAQRVNREEAMEFFTKVLGVKII